jgi:hypothetical protein
MNPRKVDRAGVKLLTELLNVGKATDEDLRTLGSNSTEALRNEA